MPDEKFMRLAIEAARKGVATGQTPFGACVVKDGRRISTAHNRVWENTDITAHAEILAIRDACAKLGTIDLSNCVLYSTCEPCPMCFSACHWARISKIVYGAGIADARIFGFGELEISNAQMKQAGGSAIEIAGGLLREECLALFAEWSERKDKRAY